MKILKHLGFLYNKEIIVDTKLKEEDVVSCEECRALVLKEEAQIVNYDIPLFDRQKYYCLKCKRPYSKVTCDLPIYGFDQKFHFWKLVEVDEKGKIIK
jgi:hypothetical protein